MTDRPSPALATPRWISGAAFLVAVFVIGLLVADQVAVVSRIGDRLSPIADPFSESDAIRSGEAYAARGFGVDFGLPDLLFGGRFPDDGMLGVHPERDRLVYTRYPPGPNWLAGVMTKLVGAGQTGRLRTLPIAVGAICLIAFFQLVAGSIGAPRAALLLLLCALPPMTRNMMHGLHYQGYALSLLLVQLGALIALFAPTTSGDGSLVAPRRLGGLLFAIGFAQGWLSFDYAFLVALAAIPIWLQASIRPALGDRRLWVGVLAPGLGFVFAHLLHVVQAALFLGGIGAVLTDLATAAGERSFAGIHGRPPTPTALVPFTLRYLHIVWHDPELFGSAISRVAKLTVLVIVFARGSITLTSPARVRVVWQLRRATTLAAIAAALVIAYAWGFVMREHAAWHYYFIPRHYFLAYFAAAVALVRAFRIDAWSSTGAEGAGALDRPSIGPS